MMRLEARCGSHRASMFSGCRVGPADVEVKVCDGEATLTGQLRSRNAQRRIADLVDSISGVKDVYNDIRVVDEQARPTRHTAR